MIDALRPDLRGTDVWRRVAAHFDELHSRGEGVPSEPREPALSRDGSAVACTVTFRHGVEDAPRTAVVVVRGDRHVIVEVEGGSVLSPVFAPDGDRLAVLADVGGSGSPCPAVWDGDRLTPLPALPGNVEHLAWSPDGGRLLALVADPGADAAGAQGSGRTSRGEVPSWLPIVKANMPVDGWRRVWWISPGEHAWHPATSVLITCWEAAWVGTGHVVAVASDRPDEAAWFSARLVEITLADGSVRTLLDHDHRCIGLPAASPGGGHVAVVRATCSDRTVVAGDVTVVDRATGALTDVDTGGVDVTWQGFADDDVLIVAGQHDLDTVVAEVRLSTCALDERWRSQDLTCGQRYPTLAVSPAGCALVVEGYLRAPELAVLDGRGLRTVSSFTHEGHRAALSSAGSLRRVDWVSTDGTALSGLVVVPDGPGPHPMITYIHGGPVWAWRSRWSMGYPYSLLLARLGFAVFHPNPRGSSGRGEAFRSAVLGDLGGAESDDVLTGVDALVADGVADPARLGVFGGSHGGFMAAWLVTVTDRFRAALPYSPVTDWAFMRRTTNDSAAQDHLLGGKPGRDPLANADRVTTPCLLVTGSRDLITPAGQGLAFHHALVEAGVEAGYVEYPEEGHGVRAFPAQIDFCARMVAWFEHHLAERS